MKKKILAGVLAGMFAVGGGILLVGCGEEDQSKLHDIFCMANSYMSEYNESITYLHKNNENLRAEASYNKLTNEFSYISYTDKGIVDWYKATKLFDNEIAYYSDDEDKVVDVPYVLALMEDEIIDEAVTEINLDYVVYNTEIEGKVEEFKADLIEDGYKVNKVSYTIKYKSIGKEKYSAKTVFAYDYDNINNGEGMKFVYEEISNIEFSEDWIYSIKESYSTTMTSYKNGVVESEESENGEKEECFSKGFNEDIYSKVDLSDKTIPEKVEQASLVLMFGQNSSPTLYVPFNVNIEDEAEKLVPLGTGRSYEFYLDEEYLLPLPAGYQLNTQTNNIIHVKSVLAEGYTEIVEVFQDSQGVRASKTSVIRLGEDFEFDNVYNSWKFLGNVYVDGKYTSASKYVFSQGEVHTILYLSEYNVDMVTKTETTFSVGGKYYFVEAGTPSEQTLRQYFNSIEAKINGVLLTNDAYSLEIKAASGQSCTLDDRLADVEGLTYAIISSIKDGYVVVENQFGKSAAQANETEITFKFNKWSQKLRLNVRGLVYEYTRFGELFGIVTLITEDEEGNTTVRLCSGFKEDTPYFFYIK